MHNTYRWYVGEHVGCLRVGIRIRNSTFAQKYAEAYDNLIGPFKTKRAAIWYIQNPTLEIPTVKEIEKLAEKAADLKRRREHGRSKGGKRV